MTPDKSTDTLHILPWTVTQTAFGYLVSGKIIHNGVAGTDWASITIHQASLQTKPSKRLTRIPQHGCTLAIRNPRLMDSHRDGQINRFEFETDAGSMVQVLINDRSPHVKPASIMSRWLTRLRMAFNRKVKPAQPLVSHNDISDSDTAAAISPDRHCTDNTAEKNP